MDLPKNYDAHESEDKWQKYWIKEGIFKFDPDSVKEIFSIDTPPPTVSGKMHIGHAFSYTHEDVIARYKRMKGFNVFYPFGTDDNGLATERLIEKTKKVKATKMDRAEFQKLCLETLEKELRPQYIADWKRIGMSCDWDIFYTTLSDSTREISQRMFLDLVKKKRAYRKKAPVMWCPQCQTALAQVELEDLEKDSHLNHIKVQTEKGDEAVFATTRPELYFGCVAITVHPDDKRYKHLVGQKVKMPLSNSIVPILADDMTKMEYGSGIVYWCPYSGLDSIEFVAKHPDLELIPLLNKDGTMNENAGKYKGLKVEDTRKSIIEDLKKAGVLIKQEKIKHVSNVHERCGTVVEFLVTRQWFVKYLELKDDFLKRGDELHWFPKHMKNRYDNWVKGLKWDWCISRQRFSGVPIPVWYDEEGKPIFASEDQLPVDPLKNLPKGYSKDQVTPEKDILDTWATSSLTPRIAAELFKDHKVFKKLLPMNLRPQAHDIISFWLFNTVVRSHLHENSLPWKDVMISGWALDPHGEKMSKSKGNVVEPQVIIEKYCADALRFWATGSRLGDDMPFQEKDVVTGMKTVTKLWNASKFAIMNLEDYDGSKPDKLEILDKWLLSLFNNLVGICTENMERYEYSKTRLETENFFWNVFCDYYLEIVKDRLYNPDKRGENSKKSAQYVLCNVLLGTLKLFAPLMPHITEEIYHLYFAKKESLKSIHISSWPEHDESLHDKEAEEIGEACREIIAAVRKHKSDNNLSLGSELEKITINGPKKLKKAENDLLATNRVKKIVFEKGKEIEIKF